MNPYWSSSERKHYYALVTRVALFPALRIPNKSFTGLRNILEEYNFHNPCLWRNTNELSELCKMSDLLTVDI